MASLVDIHKALAGRLQTIDGLRVSASPSQGMLPPLAWPQLAEAQTDSFSRLAAITYQFVVHVFTSQTARPQDGYEDLIEYADHTSPKSIRNAIWDGNDRTTQTFSGVFNGDSFVLPMTIAEPVGLGVPEFRVLGAAEIDAFQMYGGVFAVTVKTSQE